MDVFTCMYTKHKTRKSKVWHDGIAHVQRASRRVILFAASESESEAGEASVSGTGACLGTCSGVAAVDVPTRDALCDVEFETDAYLVQLMAPHVPPGAPTVTAPVVASSAPTAGLRMAQVQVQHGMQAGGQTASGDARQSIQPRRRVGMSRFAAPRGTALAASAVSPKADEPVGARAMCAGLRPSLRPTIEPQVVTHASTDAAIGGPGHAASVPRWPGSRSAAPLPQHADLHDAPLDVLARTEPRVGEDRKRPRMAVESQAVITTGTVPRHFTGAAASLDVPDEFDLLLGGVAPPVTPGRPMNVSAPPWAHVADTGLRIDTASKEIGAIAQTLLPASSASLHTFDEEMEDMLHFHDNDDSQEHPTSSVGGSHAPSGAFALRGLDVNTPSIPHEGGLTATCIMPLLSGSPSPRHTHLERAELRPASRDVPGPSLVSTRTRGPVHAVSRECLPAIGLPPPWACGLALAKLTAPCNACGSCPDTSAHDRLASRRPGAALCRRCYWNLIPLGAPLSGSGGDSLGEQYTTRMACSILRSIAVNLAPVANRLWSVLRSPHTSVEHVRAAARSAGAHLYVACDLLKMKAPADAAAVRKQLDKKKFQRRKSGNKTSAHDSDSDEKAEEPSAAAASTASALGPAAAQCVGAVLTARQLADAHTRPRLFLRLQSAERERTTEYARDDLWIVSTTVSFGVSAHLAGWPDAPALPSPTSPGARSGSKDDFFAPCAASHAFTFVARSAFHGPSSKNMIELLPVCAISGGAPGRMGGSPLPDRLWSQLCSWPHVGPNRSIRVCALRCQNITNEAAALELLQCIADPAVRLLAPLVHPLSARPGAAAAAPEDTSGDTWPALGMPGTIADVVHRWKLNDDQRRTLDACVSSFRVHADGVGRIVLCHGCFGSGKSHMICAIIQALHMVQGAAASGASARPRILVTAATNVAVDRILAGLLEAGFCDLARVGSVPRIAKRVLPYTLPHADSSEALSSTIEEMRALLAAEERMQAARNASARRSRTSDDEPDEAADLAHLREAIHALQTKRDLIATLRRATVVGATTASVAFPILSDQMFDAVIIDECSQITEVMCLGPVLRFGASVLLAVGDPKQLPPVTPAIPDVPASERSADMGAAPGPDASLFDRLLSSGLTALPLRLQYRCHPNIAALASRLFYDGTLRSGISADSRPALVAGMPPIVVVDASHTSVAQLRDTSRSSGAWGHGTYGAGKYCDERTSDGSVRNVHEARAVAQCVDRLVSAGVAEERIGVICVYRAQVPTVQLALQEIAPSVLSALQVATVDAFQGSERDVILLSTVRTSGGAFGPGARGSAKDETKFIDDPRRLNVAITRARHHLLIFGHARSLMHYPAWREILLEAAAHPGGWRTPSDMLAMPSIAASDKRSVPLVAGEDIPEY